MRHKHHYVEQQALDRHVNNTFPSGRVRDAYLSRLPYALTANLPAKRSKPNIQSGRIDKVVAEHPVGLAPRHKSPPSSLSRTGRPLVDQRAPTPARLQKLPIRSRPAATLQGLLRRHRGRSHGKPASDFQPAEPHSRPRILDLAVHLMHSHQPLNVRNRVQGRTGRSRRARPSMVYDFHSMITPAHSRLEPSPSRLHRLVPAGSAEGAPACRDEFWPGRESVLVTVIGRLDPAQKTPRRTP
jgi:hypothetical protein